MHGKGEESEMNPRADKNLLISPLEFGLATDYYELTMAAAYFNSKQTDRRGIFELFVRKLPRNRSYMVAAGLEQALSYLNDIKFGDDMISFLEADRSFEAVGDNFFEYLRDFRFTGDVWAVPEGSVLFPNEPLLRVEGPIIEAQIVETFLLSMINFQSLIATKSSRITNVSGSRSVIEFGFRRAHGPQAALLGARASYIGGCIGTSNTLAGLKMGIPIFGTMAHSYVMNFEKEMDAFREFAKVFPDGMLLVDTYDTLEAVRKIVKSGLRTSGIRLDSGDLYLLSVKSREILDGAGYKDTKIMASGDLNEYIIHGLMQRGAPIDVFGVGTELATSRDDPAMNGVYKMVGVKEPTEGGMYHLIYKLKTSPGKKTYPGPKQVFRFYKDGLIQEDIIGLEEETFENSTKLLYKAMENGKIKTRLPSLEEARDFHGTQRETLPPDFRRIDYVPTTFPVRYSDKLEQITRSFRAQ
ncbi:MAG TPA: nicotinate phosphoribosyltransferase [Candidatus Nitrosotalea sp.]|nr:nicotinate phosphoribosyltransferase [Candidatus Nitrosotalea sp.]